MWNFDKVAEEVKATGGIMPTTSFPGYSFNGDFDPNGDLTPEQYDTVYHWFVNEINNALPDDAEWVPATSSILVSIDKVQALFDFLDEYSWHDLLNDVFEKYLENCETIIGDEEND